MKKVSVIARKKELKTLQPLVKDTYHFLEVEGNLVHGEIYLHDNELNDFLTNLENAIDLRCKESIIDVSTPDFVISTALQRAEDKAEAVKDRPPVEQLIGSTKPHLRLDISKIALTSIAGIIALTGLFMNNVAIIIGAMLLSPLLGPIYAFAINTAVGKAGDVFKSIINVGVLLTMVVVFSFLATALISSFTDDLPETVEIVARTDTSCIYIFMAILLGFASIFALSKNISESIAGVAIAAALLPPAVVTGIYFRLDPSKAVTSLVLTLENVLGLMAGSLSATLILDVGPRRYYMKTVARRFIVRISAVLIVLLGLLIVSSFLL